MTSVRVYKYDLTNGMAAQLSPMFLGFQIEAIWHTSVVAYGKEFYFDGGIGISGDDEPGSTRFGRPLRADDMGTTNKTEAQFREWIRTTAAASFGPNDYRLLDRNCNHFSSAAVRFLFDNAKDLSEDVKGMIPRLLATPMGQMLHPMLQQFTMNSAGQSQQQQFQGLQNQFQHDQSQAHDNNTARGAVAHNNNHQSGGSGETNTVKNIDEDAWEKLVEEVDGKPASASLSSFLWIEQILNARAVVEGHSNQRREVFPAQSGTNNLNFDEKLLGCLGFVKSAQASSWKFSGDTEVVETAKTLISSMVGDLESRWSKETASD